MYHFCYIDWQIIYRLYMPATYTFRNQTWNDNNVNFIAGDKQADK
jgi:hypothetical protein